MLWQTKQEPHRILYRREETVAMAMARLDTAGNADGAESGGQGPNFTAPPEAPPETDRPPLGFRV